MVDIVKVSYQKRKLLGIPLFTFLVICLITGSALAFGSYLYFFTGDVTIGKSATLATAMPSSDSFVAGETELYSYAITNNANRSLDFKLEFYVEQADLEDAEANVRILNNVGTVMSSNNTLAGNKIITSHIFTIGSGATINGNVSIQFDSNADNGTYVLGLGVLGANFSFD